MPFNLFPFSGLVAGILAIIVGIVILVWPRFIAALIGIYLIIVGILTIIGPR